MKVLKEITLPFGKATFFYWNDKYIIKLESGPLEQTYKINTMDVEETDLDKILSEPFLEGVKERFAAMGQSLHQTINSL